METAFPGGKQILGGAFAGDRRVGVCVAVTVKCPLSFRSQPTADALLRVSFQATAGFFCWVLSVVATGTVSAL